MKAAEHLAQLATQSNQQSVTGLFLRTLTLLADKAKDGCRICRIEVGHEGQRAALAHKLRDEGCLVTEQLDGLLLVTW